MQFYSISGKGFSNHIWSLDELKFYCADVVEYISNITNMKIGEILDIGHSKITRIADRPMIDDYRSFTIGQISECMSKLEKMLTAVSASNDKSEIIRMSNVLTKFIKA